MPIGTLQLRINDDYSRQREGEVGSIQAPGTTSDQQARQSRRLILIYKSTTITATLLGVLWMVVFAVHGDWSLVVMEAVLTLLALTSLLLILRGRTSAGVLASQASFIAFMIVLCLVFDVPTGEVPRVTHHYFLVLALVGYINYKAEPGKAQLALIAISLLSYIIFSGSLFVPAFADPIPASIRAPTLWINLVISTSMLCGAVLVMQRELLDDSALVGELRIALRQQQFELFVQPQVDRERQIVGAEALLRWKRPGAGYVAPGDFIPVAEAAGMMPDIGKWVLADVCRTLEHWKHDDDKRHLTLSVNISADHFLLPDFERHVFDLVRTHAVEPSRLKLELTESILVTGVETVAAKMRTLRAAGITTSLDDFGTGYSSLSYLRSLPLVQLKIDRSFVRDAVEGKRGGSLANGIVQLGHDLHLQVLAEGVETEEQWEFFRNRGCAIFQGYLFGKPMPIAEFERVLDAAR